MKTKYLFFAASALLAFASCSNDDFASEKSQTLVSQPGDGSIQFGFDMQNATRADKVAEDAANLLQSQFIVYGTKHASAEAADASNDAAVFTNYKVAANYTKNNELNITEGFVLGGPSLISDAYAMNIIDPLD